MRRGPRHAPGGDAVERRDLRHRPGLRGAAAAHAGPSAARGAPLRRPDAATSCARSCRRSSPGWTARSAAAPGPRTSRRPGTTPRPSSHRIFADEEPEPRPGVTLTDFDPEGEDKVLAAICYPQTTLPEDQILARVRRLGTDERASLLAAYVGERTNRRHKPGPRVRAHRLPLRRARGLRRVPRPATSSHAHHRVAGADAEARLRGPRLGRGSGGDAPRSCRRWNVRRRCTARWHFGSLSKPRTRCRSRTACGSSMQMNAREAMHLIELRTTPQGHPAYRHVAPGDAPADRGGGRPPRARRGDELRRPRGVRARATRVGTRRGDAPRGAVVTVRARLRHASRREFFFRPCDLRRRAAPQVRGPRAWRAALDRTRLRSGFLPTASSVRGGRDHFARAIGAGLAATVGAGGPGDQVENAGITRRLGRPGQTVAPTVSWAPHHCLADVRREYRGTGSPVGREIARPPGAIVRALHPPDIAPRTPGRPVMADDDDFDDDEPDLEEEVDLEDDDLDARRGRRGRRRGRRSSCS